MTFTPREMLERLCAERGENFASLSRLLGRNEAYIQQYLRKGSPRRLTERDRRTLARYFQVSDVMLGGPPDDSPCIAGELVPVSRSPVRTAPGRGGVADDEIVRPC